MVRLAAVRAILQLGGDEQIPTLLNLFKGPDKSARAAVIQLLGERRDPRILPNLAEALKSDGNWVCVWSRWTRCVRLAMSLAFPL